MSLTGIYTLPTGFDFKKIRIISKKFDIFEFHRHISKNMSKVNLMETCRLVVIICSVI